MDCFLFSGFMQVIGGIIMNYARNHDESRMAKECMYVGIVISADFLKFQQKYLKYTNLEMILNL